MTRAPGYVLEVPAEATDVVPVRAGGGGGPSPAGPPAPERVRAAAHRGRGSSGAGRPTARCATSRSPGPRPAAWKKLLLSAAETRIDAELTLGRHEAVIGELEALTERQPHARAAVVAAHAGALPCGRQAEALRVFQDLRAVLVAELGIEPGHDVTWMEHAILAQDPGARLRGSGRSRRRARPSERAAAPPRLPGPGARLTARRPTGRPRPRVGTCCATGGHRCARVPGGSSWSTVTRASGRRSWWPSWRGRRGRGCAGAVGPLRRGPGGAVPALRGGARAVLPVALGGPDLAHARAGSSPSSPASSCGCGSTRRCSRTRGAIPKASASASSRR